MINEETLMHQHEDSAGRIFGSKHLVTDIHSKKTTIKAHNLTIERDGLTDFHQCIKLGLKRIPYQGGD